MPRPRAYVSAREAMLYALLMIALVLIAATAGCAASDRRLARQQRDAPA